MLLIVLIDIFICETSTRSYRLETGAVGPSCSPLKTRRAPEIKYFGRLQIKIACFEDFTGEQREASFDPTVPASLA